MTTGFNDQVEQVKQSERSEDKAAGEGERKLEGGRGRMAHRSFRWAIDAARNATETAGKAIR
jgi:hypothetical protein